MARLEAALLLTACGCVSLTRDQALTDRLRQRPPAFCWETPRIEIAAPTTVPLTMLFDLPTVTVRAGDRDLTFLLDSGSQFCLVAPEIVEELDLPHAGFMHLSLLGETTESPITCIHELVCGGIRCSHLPFVVSPGHLKRHFLGFPLASIDGVLGMPFLVSLTTTIDFPRKTVSFAAAAPVAAGPRENIHVLPLRFLEDGRPWLPIALGDGVNHPFLLDTGARPCVVSARLAKRYGLAAIGEARLLSLGVELEATLTELAEVNMGDVMLAGVRAYVLPAKHEHMFKAVDGIVGADVLKDFVVTIDPAGGNFILEERGCP